MNDLKRRIETLDTSLYEVVRHLLLEWDRRTLLGLHAAVASMVGSFTYLEIGSYLGGSMQVLIRDPSCRRIISIDARIGRDKRIPELGYEDNSTEEMINRLRRIPGADLSKLVTLEMRSEDVCLDGLQGRPDFCFIDGEHTDDAVLHDAELCMAAIDGDGVIAFHDYPLVQPGIQALLRARWNEISMAMAFPGAVFAVEVGGRGMLRSATVERAIGSTWHSAAWRAASRWRRSPQLLLSVWATMPHLDALIFEGRRRLHLSRRDSRHAATRA